VLEKIIGDGRYKRGHKEVFSDCFTEQAECALRRDVALSCGASGDAIAQDSDRARSGFGQRKRPALTDVAAVGADGKLFLGRERRQLLVRCRWRRLDPPSAKHGLKVRV
jgi:hypothetical protein